MYQLNVRPCSQAVRGLLEQRCSVGLLELQIGAHLTATLKPSHILCSWYCVVTYVNNRVTLLTYQHNVRHCSQVVKRLLERSCSVGSLELQIGAHLTATLKPSYILFT